MLFRSEVGSAAGGDKDEHIPDRASPYGALARAVANEERAFNFYCRLAASATDPQMRAYAKAFAEEELAHAALLRAQRRQAFRSEHARSDSQLPDPKQISTREDLIRAALASEGRLASLASQGPLARACQALLADLAAEIGAERPRPDVDVSSPPPARERHTPPAIRGELDRLFSFYDRVAHTTKDESVARTAQSLMAATLDRIRMTVPFDREQPD